MHIHRAPSARPSLPVLVAALAVVSAPVILGRAQAPAPAARTVQDGVYTEAQAARGQAAYESACSGCHQDGPTMAAGLVGGWNGAALADLFSQLTSSMPLDNPGGLDNQTYIDIVAYLLQAYELPAGTAALDIETARSVRIVAQASHGPAPDAAPVRVVGCLAQSADAAWLLARASEPVAAADAEPSTGGTPDGPEPAALGTATLGLVNLNPAPDPYKGHKIEARGFLIRDPGGDRINVTSVRTLAAACE